MVSGKSTSDQWKRLQCARSITTCPPSLPLFHPLSFPACLQAWEESNADDYTDHCAEYNAISALDPWKTSLLVKAKRMIAAAAHGEEDVDLT